MTAPGGVLALDLATMTGWAYGGHDERPIYGGWLLGPAGSRYGERWARLGNELADAIEVFQPSLVVCEAALVVEDSAARFLLGLSAHATSTCWRESVKQVDVRADVVRLAVLGTGRFRKGEVKGEVIAWARDQGFTPADDNEADALCVLRYSLMRLHPRARRAA